MRTLLLGGAVLAALVIGHARPGAAKDAPTNPYPGYRSAIYADPARWLCRGDTDDVCDHDLDATSVKANGKTRVEHWHEGRHPKFDCFYVYPTISSDPTGNSDLVPDAKAELFVVRQQAARLGTVCRVFAPVYRQVTLTALLSILAGQPVDADIDLPYSDVVDAWKHYIANDNQGRGVLLIGHSQGAGILVDLIKNEIDPSPELRDRLVSAILLGTSLQVPDGQDVGGDFASIPLCHSPHDTGCAISYASFRASAPPPGNSFFGESERPGLKAACTNPASLKGGKGFLHPFLPTDGTSLPIITVPPPTWVDPAKRPITTPFVTLPRFVEAQCAETNGFVYLSLTPEGNRADPRIDDIGGDLTPEWGLHLVDANIAMGDLVAVAGSQGKAWRAHH